MSNTVAAQAEAILKSTFMLAASRVVERASTVFVGIFVARQLGANGLGIYSAATVFYGLIFLAGEMGATNYLVRELAKTPQRTSSYISHLALMATVSSSIAIGAAWIILPHLGYSNELLLSTRVILLAVIPGALRTIQEAVFVAHGRVQFITYAAALAAVVNICATLLLLYAGFGVVSLVIAFALVQLVQTISYFIFVNRHITPIRWEFDSTEALRILSGIKAFAGSSLLGGVLSRPEILILAVFRNPTEIGIYTAALKLVDVWQIIPQTYMTNVFPVLSRSYHERAGDAARIVNDSLKYLLAVMLPIAAGLFTAATPIVHLVYGPGFNAAIRSLQILAWTVPLSAVFAVLWRALAARGKQDVVFRIQLVVMLLRLVAGYACIAALGSTGAAVASTSCILLHDIFLACAARRESSELPLFRLAWRLCCAAVVMGIGVFVLSPRLSLWALVPLASVIYAALLIVFRVFSASDFAMIRSLAPGKAP